MTVGGLQKETPSVLVTGSTGFLGLRLVKSLLKNGYRVRALARRTSNTANLHSLDVEICYGDIADKTSLEAAFAGINVVVHAAADTKGSAIESKKVTVNGTRNIIELSKQYEIDRLIYISSCAVYGISQCRPGQLVDESGSVERHPEKRGFYSEGKIKAEALLLNSAKENGVPFVCLRPGTIFGEGGEIFTPMIGFSKANKFFFIIDNDKFVLPFVYVDSLVDAIRLAIDKKESEGQIYNVVDPDGITKKEYIELFLRKLYPKAHFFFIPLSLINGLVGMQEYLMKLLGRHPLLTRYRLLSSQQKIVYDSSKIQRELGWKPTIPLREAIKKVLAYEKAKQKSRGS